MSMEKHQKETSQVLFGIRRAVQKLNDLLEFHLFAVKPGATSDDVPDTVGKGLLNVSAILALLKWRNVERTITLKKGPNTSGFLKIRIFMKGGETSSAPIVSEPVRRYSTGFIPNSRLEKNEWRKTLGAPKLNNTRTTGPGLVDHPPTATVTKTTTIRTFPKQSPSEVPLSSISSINPSESPPHSQYLELTSNQLMSYIPSDPDLTTDELEDGQSPVSINKKRRHTGVKPTRTKSQVLVDIFQRVTARSSPRMPLEKRANSEEGRVKKEEGRGSRRESGTKTGQFQGKEGIIILSSTTKKNVEETLDDESDLLKNLATPSFSIDVDLLAHLRNHLLNDAARLSFANQGGYALLVRRLVSCEDQPLQATITSILRERLNERRAFESVFVEGEEPLNQLVACGALTEYTVTKSGIYSLLLKAPRWSEELGLDFNFHSRLLAALSLYSYKHHEKNRFQHLISSLQYESSPFTQSFVMKLINMLISMEKDLDERLGLRSQFMILGLEEIMNRLDTNYNTLREEIKTFNEHRTQDEKQYKTKLRKLLQITGDINDPKYLTKLAEAIIKRVTGIMQIQATYGDILQYLLRFQLDTTVGLPKWKLVEKVVRQLSGNKKKITFDDYKYFSLKKLMKGIQNGEG